MIAGATTFDELNALVKKRRSEPYDEYFGVMELTEEEYEERIEMAEEFESRLLPIMMLLFSMQLYDAMNWQMIQEQLSAAYADVLTGRVALDENRLAYIENFANEAVKSTQDHMDDPYYFSQDRAQFIAENEANTTANYAEFMRAVEKGYTKKRWVDIRDKRERETHREVGGTVLSIWEPFRVGEALMMYPKDESLGAGPEEIVGCRCHVVYTNRTKNPLTAL